MFLSEPDETSPGVRRLYDADLADDGYVMNLTRVWAHVPEVTEAYERFVGSASAAAGELSFRDKGVVIAAMAATLGDSYCATAWGARLAGASSPETSAAVLSGGDDPGLDERERALARWARLITRDPSGASAGDVDELRAVGLTDPQIAGLTCYIAARIAFATVNDALGARPDRQLAEQAPEAVRAAITFGRPPGT
jgi:alkylhydroperoxidase family enzyme